MKQLRALLVGAGGMGQNWAKNLGASPDVELAGWVDIQPGAAAKAASALDVPPPYTGEELAHALQTVQPDFVVDVTVPQAHTEVTLQALAAGLPVLGEKPMADSMERARSMVAAAEQAGKLFMVSQSRRYHPQLQAMRRLITTALGPIGILNSDFYIGAHFGGFRDAMASPLLLDMAIHTFDAARYLSGSDPVAVYCEEFNPSWSWYSGNACATAIFEMTGGLRYTYRGSWCSAGHHTSWDASWRAVGPHGTALWDGEQLPVADIVIEPGGFHDQTAIRTADVEADVAVGIAGSLQDFVQALRTGSIPMGECHDNVKSLAMVFGAIESVQTGQRVQIRL